MTIRPRTLTAIVITLNEERNIGACLDSLRWADEVIVVDSCSTDRTAEIARERGATVITESWCGYGRARNRAAAVASGEWIVVVDADERVPEPLASEIRSVVSGEGRPAAGVYEVARRAYFLGRWIRHCGWYPGYVPRLFRNGEARYDEARVHE
ncbi:MAG TPA: glycosyltransferase family 2 protein, partial [Bacteroidota bacterium]|nr:glycosyltransferase family 2 protein [Bacteroidota bacterium]